VRKRVFLIGRHDYWPGYTPEVIKNLDFDLWPSLALMCDRITEQHEQASREMEQKSRFSGRR
jgi:hypothetical protein